MRNPDRLVLSRGGGCIALFGLIWLGFGLFALASPYLGMTPDMPHGPAPFAIPILLGLGFILGRIGVTLDRQQRTLTKWWGMVGLQIPRATEALDGYQWVGLWKEIRRNSSSSGGSGGSRTVFPVRLAKATESDKADPPLLSKGVTLGEPQVYDLARAQAERVAKFLELGMADLTTDPPAFREAGTLDLSLGERLRKAPPEPPDEGQLGRLSYTRAGDEATVVTPPLGPMAGVGCFSCGGIAAGGAVFVLNQFIGDTGAFPPETTWIVAAIVGALIVLVSVATATAYHRIEIGPAGLVIHARSALFRRRRSLQWDDIEEVEVSTDGRGWSKGIVVVRGDWGTAYIGQGLVESEQEWLRRLLHCAAAAGGRATVGNPSPE